MKKGALLVVFAFVSLLFLTACGGGGKKLVCTISQVQSTGLGEGFNMDMNGEVSMGLDGENISSMDMDVKIVLQDNLYAAMEEQGDIDTQMKTIVDQIESSLENSSEFKDAIKNKNSKYNGKTITVEIEFDMSKANRTITKEEAIQNLESQGYKCEK